MKKNLIFLLLGVSSFAFAQTKLIAFRSHSGKTSNFKFSIPKSLAEEESSNFGRAPERIVKTAKLDSVLFISDTAVVMVTSKTCFDREEKTTSLWKPGKDTVYNHPVFSQNFSKYHSVDSLRKIIKKSYYFRNNADSIKFIGFDKETTLPDEQGKGSNKDETKKNFTPVPVIPDYHIKPPFGKNSFLLLGAVFFLILLFLTFARKVFKV